jgi:hypothetical protein
MTARTTSTTMNGIDSRNAKSPPEKLTPRSARPSDAARIGGRNGLTPEADARPVPCPMSRKREMATRYPGAR